MSDINVPTEYAGPKFTLAKRMAEAQRDLAVAALSKFVGVEATDVQMGMIRSELITALSDRSRHAYNMAITVKVTEDGKVQPHFDEVNFFRALIGDLEEANPDKE